jgi:hypothetical protein
MQIQSLMPGSLVLQMKNTYTGVYVPTGITDEGLRSHLAPWKNTRLLDFRNMLPGTFGGFTDPAVAKKLDDTIFMLFSDKKWCCSGEQPMENSHLEWPYALPGRLQERSPPVGAVKAPPAPHPLPVYRRPDFCDSIQADQHNARFLSYSNHPCTYLAMGIQFPLTVEELFA